MLPEGDRLPEEAGHEGMVDLEVDAHGIVAGIAHAHFCVIGFQSEPGLRVNWLAAVSQVKTAHVLHVV